MNDPSIKFSEALMRSLIEAPKLVGDLPEAKSFDSTLLTKPDGDISLNFQQKLGHIYEDALAVLLESSSYFGILARSFQIHKNRGPTLGELDFLLKDHRNAQLIHLELAVKFFLAVESGNGLLLPGPNPKDNYHRKLEKMRSHQLVLTKKYQDELPDGCHAASTIVRQLLHGCIFDHVQARKPAVAPFLNPNGRRGKWLHAKDCQSYFGKGAHLEIIPKPLWPVPLVYLKELPLEPWEPVEEVDRCVMLRFKTQQLPYFVTPNGYPNGANSTSTRLSN